MPNVTYDGTNGIVQSTGSADFTVSGTGISQDVESLTLANGQPSATLRAKGYGVTRLDITGAVTLELPPPPREAAGVGGQMKLIVVDASAGGGSCTLKTVTAAGAEITADLPNDALTAINDFVLCVWKGGTSGERWHIIHEVTT